jgi:hypothetical protein
MEWGDCWEDKILNATHAVVFCSFMGCQWLSSSNVEVVQVRIYHKCTLPIDQQMQFFIVYFLKLVYLFPRIHLFWNSQMFFLSRLKLAIASLHGYAFVPWRN